MTDIADSNLEFDKPQPIQTLKVQGLLSLVDTSVDLNAGLNVFIGPNGCGKSNLMTALQMMRNLLANTNIDMWVKRKWGTLDKAVSFGIKNTQKINLDIEFINKKYYFSLESSEDSQRVITGEKNVFLKDKKSSLWVLNWSLESGKEGAEFFDYCYSYEVVVYHFHDTSATANMRRQTERSSHFYGRVLEEDGANIAPFLYHTYLYARECYESIVERIRLVMPFFDDFVWDERYQPTQPSRTLDKNSFPKLFPENVEPYKDLLLYWRRRNSDYIFSPIHFSDGSLRFICLVAALMQPNPPTILAIDEPELGLHPYAINVLAALLRSASHRMQIIVATQSVTLINELRLDDLVVVDNKEGATCFSRHDSMKFKKWLKKYTLGDLWESNFIGGNPLS